MSRVNFILLALLIASALATVASTHRARKLFTELEQSQAEQKRIDIEWGQLQLEQSTWAKHALVESLASKQLGMRVPDAGRIQFLNEVPDVRSRDGAAGASGGGKP